MVYNSFYTNVLARLILLLLTITGLAYLFVLQDRFFTILSLALLALVQTILLFSYLNRTNRDLARFLLLLTEEDTSVVAWKERVERTFKGLHHSFRKVNEEINRMRLEKEKSAILLKGIVQHMNTGIIVHDEDGRIEVINDNALKLLGIKGMEKMDDLEQVMKGVSREFLDLRYDSGNVIRFRKQGPGNAPLLVRASLLKLEDRKLKIYSLQDIETQLEANEIETWQKMTRILSHEISNSITPISTLGAGIHLKLSRGKSDTEGRMIINSNDSKDLLESSELIQQRCDALIEFMEHYKTFARLPDPVPGKLGVDALFRSLELFFKEEMEKLGISLEFSLPGASLNLRADQKLLEQAFINLIRNAAEAMKGTPGGIIHVGVRKSEDHRLILHVRDNGPGIASEIQSQVFTPFFTTKPGGTGIGLSIVKKIIIMNGGAIRFNSTPGHGTEFEIMLPED